MTPERRMKLASLAVAAAAAERIARRFRGPAPARLSLSACAELFSMAGMFGTGLPCFVLFPQAPSPRTLDALRAGAVQALLAQPPPRTPSPAQAALAMARSARSARDPGLTQRHSRTAGPLAAEAAALEPGLRLSKPVVDSVWLAQRPEQGLLSLPGTAAPTLPCAAQAVDAMQERFGIGRASILLDYGPRAAAQPALRLAEALAALPRRPSRGRPPKAAEA